MIVKLLSGRRRISTMQFATVLTSMVACASFLLFGLNARSTALHSQQIADHAVVTERAILTVIVLSCEARVNYDAQSLETVKRLHAFGAALDAVSSQTVIPPDTPAKTRSLFIEQVRAIHALAIGTDSLASRQVINNCPKYTKLLDDLPAERK